MILLSLQKQLNVLPPVRHLAAARNQILKPKVGLVPWLFNNKLSAAKFN
jgi:hypothetical protein